MSTVSGGSPAHRPERSAVRSGRSACRGRARRRDCSESYARSRPRVDSRCLESLGGFSRAAMLQRERIENKRLRIVCSSRSIRSARTSERGRKRGVFTTSATRRSPETLYYAADGIVYGRPQPGRVVVGNCCVTVAEGMGRRGANRWLRVTRVEPRGTGVPAEDWGGLFPPLRRS